MNIDNNVKEETWFIEPNDSDVVWRYMDFSHYITLLTSENNPLWFSRIDCFDDPYEGMPTRKDLENHITRGSLRNSSVDAQQREKRRVVNRYKEVSKKVFANCWYRGDKQSDAMWRLYPNSEEGVAIRTTIGDLKAALESRYDLFFANVNYVDWDTHQTPNPSLMAPALQKRDAFNHENEMRILLRHESWEDAYGHPYGVSTTPKGIEVESNIEDMIDEMYTSPQANNWFHQTVHRITEEYVSKPVKKSNLYNLLGEE